MPIPTPRSWAGSGPTTRPAPSWRREGRGPRRPAVPARADRHHHPHRGCRSKRGPQHCPARRTRRPHLPHRGPAPLPRPGPPRPARRDHDRGSRPVASHPRAGPRRRVGASRPHRRRHVQPARPAQRYLCRRRRRGDDGRHLRRPAPYRGVPGHLSRDGRASRSGPQGAPPPGPGGPLRRRALPAQRPVRRRPRERPRGHGRLRAWHRSRPRSPAAARRRAGRERTRRPAGRPHPGAALVRPLRRHGPALGNDDDPGALTDAAPPSAPSDSDGPGDATTDDESVPASPAQPAQPSLGRSGRGCSVAGCATSPITS